jgi:hypothetical protein
MWVGELMEAARPWKRRALPWIFLSVFMPGCAHPLAERSAQYAVLGRKAAVALQPLSSLTRRTCLQSARTEFVQQRLLRLEGEYIGRASDAKYYVDEAHWLAKTPAISGSLTWESYCSEMAASTVAFRLGLDSLSAYADSIGSLSDLGRGIAPDWAGLLASAEAIQGGLSNPDSHFMKLVAPMTNPIKELTNVWLTRKAEASLASYLVQAQPLIAQLIESMQQYLSAVSDQLETLATRQSTLIQSLELVAGLGGKIELTRGQKCHPASTSATGSATPDSDILVHLCERTALQQKQIDALVVILLHDNTQALTTTTQFDKAAVGLYKATLNAFLSTQTQLSAAAQTANDLSLGRTSLELAHLSQALERLDGANTERTGY